MTEEFASIELARLYETQGYLEDALAMYQNLDQESLKNGAEIRAALKRVQLAMDCGGRPDKAGLSIDQALKDINGPDPGIPMTPGGDEPIHRPCDPGEPMARIMEKWLMLMVVRQRLNLFQSIRDRL